MKPPNSLRFAAIASAVGLLGLGPFQSASAALLVYEPFDYAVGSDLLGANGGAGFGEAWRVRSAPADVPAGSFTAISGSLSHPTSTLSTLGNSAIITGEFGTAQPMRNFAAAATVADGSTLWFSFIGERLGEPTAVGTNPYPRGVTVSLFGENDEKTGIGNSTAAAADEWSLVPDGSGGLRVGSGSPFSELAWAVMRIDFIGGINNQYLWLNPDPNVEPSTVDADVTILNAAAVTAIDAIRPFIGNTQTDRPFGVLAIDEIRLGTTYADMSAIPEPGSMALLLLGGSLAFRRRRA